METETEMDSEVQELTNLTIQERRKLCEDIIEAGLLVLKLNGHDIKFVCEGLSNVNYGTLKSKDYNKFKICKQIHAEWEYIKSLVE